MIYLADDYVNKYQDALSYILSRAVYEKYSFSYIEKVISYSSVFSELEKSNVTQIAFSSYEKNYSILFPDSSNNDFVFNPYDMFSWIGSSYMKLFLSLEITFELLFIILPLPEMMNLYSLYHEMDYTQLLNHVRELVPFSPLDTIMKNRNISSNKLSELSGVSCPTIKALRYGRRDINKFEAGNLFKVAIHLNVKAESLLTSIYLIKECID